MKHTLSALVLLSAVSLPALATAQELGAKGDVVFSADRMMGISGTHVAGENGPADYENDWTSFSFGWRGSPDTSPFDLPRVSFDYLIIDHLSIGGSLGYFEVNPDEGAEYSAFLFNPRVGYALAFGRVVGMWPRGGFTYHSLNAEFGNDDVEESGFALSVECPFTFSPTPHFAFHVGPTFDIDMFGERDPSPVDSGDRKFRSFGLNAGLLGWF
jgi:hypothetical protein